MLTLHDNPFSPFARKVRLVLDRKGLAYASIDALALTQAEALATANPRREVPVLVDGDLVVTNSRDIVDYLEHRHPAPPVLPADPATRAAARAWERLADTVLDAIIHDVSLWTWPTHHRDDRPPAGLVEAAMRDVTTILERLERALPSAGFLCGAEVSIADLALFPHLTSLKALGIGRDPGAHPRLETWNRRMRALSYVAKDLDYVKRSVTEKFGGSVSPYEGHKVVWRGDRIEWLFRHGFADWWYGELAAGRVVIPDSL
jgi:glutathione S-transferase